MRRLIIAVAVAFVCFDALVIGAFWLWSRNSRPALETANGRSVLLASKAGERYIGEQLQFFAVDNGGVISATNESLSTNRQ